MMDGIQRMSPITHFLTGWIVANADHLDRRDRAIATAAAVAPDLDGLGIVADFLTRQSEHPLSLYPQYHHVLGHNLGFGLLLSFLGFILGVRKWRTAGFVLLNFHLHLLFDLAGSRGPDGYQWSIPYLLPFSSACQLVWDGQWELNAWPNFVVTGISLATIFVLAWKRGYSPLEMVSESANKAFVETIRRRFPARA
jgi:inner membrane protein